MSPPDALPTRSGLPWPGRHYHRRYGYAVRWAVPAELAWRLEHAPFGAAVRSAGYRWRKHFERKGAHE